MTSHIKNKGSMINKDLNFFRDELDELDINILNLISRRFLICSEVALYKKENAIPMMQHDRVNMVKKSRVQTGERFGLRRSFVEKLYELIIQEACELEDSIINMKG